MLERIVTVMLDRDTTVLVAAGPIRSVNCAVEAMKTLRTATAIARYCLGFKFISQTFL